jgi:hypothetical protein
MSEKPKRIQRKRTKGWKMPEGAVYVGRPTKWGNPFPVPENATHDDLVCVVGQFRLWWRGSWFEIQEELRGKDLACWCALDKPCHADVLLEIANGGQQ